MNRKENWLAALVAVFLILATNVLVYASEPKPTVKLDVRSAKQAILTIEDEKLSQLKQEVSYNLEIGNYSMSLSWMAQEAERSDTALCSFLYHESSDNSIVRVSAEQYPDNSFALYANKIGENTLQLQLDLSGEALPISTSESPRDLSEHLRNIDFLKFGDTLNLSVQYDGELNNYIEQSFTYAKDEFFYDKKRGLTFFIEMSNDSFDRLSDFGRVAGLTDEEITQLYWTPKTDNYLITKSRQEQKYEYGAESYVGMADVYDMACFDENGRIVSMQSKFIFDDENGLMANFRNVETTPQMHKMVSRCINVYPINPEERRATFWRYRDSYIAELQQNGLTKEMLLGTLSADTEVVENASGKGR